VEAVTGPLISVIIPVHNAAHFLPDALASIAAQDYAPFEILVINDRSDDLAELERVCAASPDVRLLHLQEGKGPAPARNLGLREARGDYFAFLDADDTWTPYKTRVQADRLRAQPELDAVIGRTQMTSVNGAAIPDLRYEDGGRWAFVHMATGLYRRRLFDAIGHFDPNLYFSEDYDWFLRLLESDAPILKMQETFQIYRCHGANMTAGKTAKEVGLERMLMRSLARRRARGGSAIRSWGSLEELAAPRISVIIPAYNAARHLSDAIASVRAQTLPAAEIIVVDDGSTDDTATIAANDNVRLIRQDNGGAAKARNTGVREAAGNQIAFLDADDVWRPEKLAQQWRLLSASPFPELVFGDVEQDGTRMAGIHAGAMLARRSAFQRAGYFDESLRTGEFLDWYSRAREAGISTAETGTVVFERRIHGANTMLTAKDPTRDYLRILKASLDRRRKAAE